MPVNRFNGAPPVYRPFAEKKLIQPSAFSPVQPGVQLKPANTFPVETRPAPPVYRPAAVAQQKSHIGLGSERRPAPPVYQPKAVAQQKPTPSWRPETRSAPPVYSPRPVDETQVAQRTKAPMVHATEMNLNIPRQSIYSPVHALARPQAFLQVRASRSSVLQCMEGPPEPEMKSQFNKSENSILGVDLNCGRYCTESAMKWWAQTLRWDIGNDVFHLLPEPTPKTIFSVKASWSPGVEGKDFTKSVTKPTNLLEWENAINKNGPLIVSGALGDAYLVWVGHYILIIGVDRHGNQLICKDPLKGNQTIRYEFDWIQNRIETVHAIKLEKLQEFKQ